MGRCGCSGPSIFEQGQEFKPAKAIGRIKFVPDNFHPFDPFTQASITIPLSLSEAPPSPAPINDNGIATDPDYFAHLWELVAHKRLDLIEARIAKLEKRRQLQMVGGGGVEADIAHVRHELAFMGIAVAGFLGLPIPDNLPDDLLGMR
jgi:hypothetical protein